MGRRKDNIGKDLIELGALMPWWLSLALAIGAYLLFRNLTTIETGAGSSTDLGYVIPRQVLKTASALLQYVVPALLLIGTLTALLNRLRRGRLFNSVSRDRTGDRLDSLGWKQFEDLVYEHFQRQGYDVTETSKGPDGGIDLKLRKAGKAATVQCKHWRNKKVGVDIIREQFGIMTAEGVAEGFVVTSGQFTNEAFTFAKGKPIHLVDGAVLRRHFATLALNHDGAT